ncbi:MAG: hypothetical protein A2V77_01595 [Anaeromyxobacter sp. RBG_16_69_14]|nr:MAG: hypothetical protein A2V77_01595 [Anaeromyxobacter sp. RBG_16_69_14]
MKPLTLITCILCSLGSSVAIASPNSFRDPLDTPAVNAFAPASQSLLAAARAGATPIAVGMRGLIVASEDGGASWEQRPTPVQSDLTSVSFPDAQHGWAAGHDGVILQTNDGGRSWNRQLDGRMAAERFTAHYATRIAQGEEKLGPLLAELKRNYQAGPSLPWLDICFEDANQGYAVGPFGSIARTDDGGKTWLPAMERIDNPDLLNLNAIRGIAGELYIAAERGTVFRLDRAQQRFLRAGTGYAGSFFGIAGDARALVAYGLRGTVFRSSDGGATWSRSTTPTPVAVTAGAALPDGRIVLATLGGMIWIGEGDMARFVSLAPGVTDAFTAVTALDARRLLLAGLRGAHVKKLP